MTTIKDYFVNHKNYKYPGLQMNPEHQKSIKDFYEAFIQPRLKEWYEDQHDNLVTWCDALESYANGPMPIYWIRRFESGGENVNDNRRGSVTVEVDGGKNAVAAYAYISNFDAQELYNMIRCDVDPGEFETLMKTGKYEFHYDKGNSSVESAIHVFPCLDHAKSMGVFNEANLYLAHVTDVNGTYTPAAPYDFIHGDHKTDWKTAAEHKRDGYDFSALFTLEKLRVLSTYTGDVCALKAFLKAHFFRFVHPFNYFLVPGKSYEINAVYGKTKTGVGEDGNLIKYVRCRMYKDFIKDDAALADYYARFEDAIQIPDDRKLSKHFADIEKDALPLGDEAIHIVYGTSIGEEGKALKKLAKKVSNSKDVYAYCKDNYLNKTTYDIMAGGSKLGVGRATASNSAAKLLEKICAKVNGVWKDKPEGFKVEIVFNTSPATKTSKKSSKTKSSKKTSTPKTGSSGKTRRRYTEDEKLRAAAYYLTHKTGLIPAEESIGRMGGSGSLVLGWFRNELGIDTGKHKGLFAESSDIDRDLDLAIAHATGKFKETLKKIKEKGFIKP